VFEEGMSATGYSVPIWAFSTDLASEGAISSELRSLE